MKKEGEAAHRTCQHSLPRLCGQTLYPVQHTAKVSPSAFLDQPRTISRAPPLSRGACLEPFKTPAPLPRLNSLPILNEAVMPDGCRPCPAPWASGLIPRAPFEHGARGVARIAGPAARGRHRCAAVQVPARSMPNGGPGRGTSRSLRHAPGHCPLTRRLLNNDNGPAD